MKENYKFFNTCGLITYLKTKLTLVKGNVAHSILK